MRYFLYLLLYIPAQLFAYLITPLLPMFAANKYGPIDNANGLAAEPRLPLWIDFFNTYDNSLWGDNGWKRSRDATTYGAMVAWLYRNSFYTGKLKLFGMPIETVRWSEGDPTINYHNRVFGALKIRQPNGAWQYKSVKPFFGRVLILNFGWLLDDASQERALFMFSVRLKKI